MSKKEFITNALVILYAILFFFVFGKFFAILGLVATQDI